ncbi:MAG: prepilin peptidase, partial [Erysipelotrichaceae bacterium]|nr:prepilin peptidase [Erysipelotrichaceae bacterium]
RYQRPCILLIFDLSLFCIVFGLSLVDMRSYIIPDGFIVAGVLNWFIRSLLTGFEYGSIASAFLLSLSIIFLSMIMNKVNGKENFGGGDIKLIFMAVLYTGLMKGVLLLFLSSILGLFGIWISRNKKIPFGPYISFALFLVLLYGDLMFEMIFL